MTRPVDHSRNVLRPLIYNKYWIPDWSYDGGRFYPVATQGTATKKLEKRHFPALTVIQKSENVNEKSNRTTPIKLKLYNMTFLLYIYTRTFFFSLKARIYLPKVNNMRVLQTS